MDSIFFSYRELTVLKGAFLKITPGKICALFGKNGIGKSTLLKIASGQLLPKSGITMIDGQRLHKRSLRNRFTKIAFLSQKSMLPTEMKVQKLISSMTAAKKLTEDPLIKKIDSQRIYELSGGERRYLELSLLLNLNRDYILLDEPFTGIAPVIVERLIKRIKQEAQEGKGILLTDHYHQFVLETADEAYILQHRQCYNLGNNFTSELKKLGYVR